MRKSLLVVVLLALVLTVSACANESATSPAVATTPPANIVRVAYPPGSDADVLNSLIAAYQDAHPGRRVVKVPLTGEIWSEQAAIAFNGKADLLFTNGFGPGSKKWFKPLDSYLQQHNVDVAPYGSVLDEMRLDGVLYEMPIEFQPSLLYYNPAVFAQHSVAEPTEGWTWDQFRTTIRTLTQDSGQQPVWGFTTNYNYENLVMAYVQEKAGVPPWKAPPAVVGEALQFFAVLLFNDHSAPVAPKPSIDANGMGRRPSVALGPSLQPLSTGQAAMAMGSPWTAAKIPPHFGPNLTLKVAPIPTFTGTRPVGAMQPIGVGILQGSTNPDAAWQFLQFASGEQGAAVIAKKGFTPAYFTDSVAQAWAKRPDGMIPGLSTVLQTNWQVWGMGYDNGYTRWMALFTRAVDATLSGSVSWDQALDEFEKGIQKFPPGY